MEQIYICSGGCHTCADGVLQHIAGAAGVLTHYDLRPVGAAVVPAQEAADLVCVFSGESFAGLAAESVRTKIFAHENIPP